MKKSILIKTLSVILSLIMILSVPLSVSGATLVYYPVIYCAGIEESVLYENPNKQNPSVAFGVNDTAFVSSCTNLLTSVLLYDSFKNQAMNIVVNELNKIFDPIKCKADGTSANPNVSTWYYNKPLSEYEGEEIDTANLRQIINVSGGRISADDIYVFTSDWRIDPFVNAASLKDYVDLVISKTGAKKVTLLCGGYGGIAGATYLYDNAKHAAKYIDSVTFVNCPLWGNSLIGDLMTGAVYQTAGDADSLLNLIDIVDGTARGQAFTEYLADDPSGFFADVFSKFMGEGPSATLIGALAMALIKTIISNENLDKAIGASYNKLLITGNKAIYTSCVKEYIANMPGLWAMVPPEYYDYALDFIFGDKLANAKLYDKITSYRDVIEGMDDILLNAKKDKIKVYVVANYGIQILPLTSCIKDESDGMLATRLASAGATTEECGIYWAGYDNCTNAYHDHMSPNGDIDASTCALPENTWFIKGLAHLDFSCETASRFLVWLMTSEEQKTVWDNNFYTQYMKYNKYSDAITAFTNVDEVLGYMYGDYDFSGKVDAADARLVLRTVVGLEEKPSKYKFVVGDVNGDGYLEAADARLILRYAVGLDAHFPVD